MDGGTDGLMDGWVDIISCSMCIHRIRNLYTHIYIYIIIHIHIHTYIHIYIYMCTQYVYIHANVIYTSK